MQLSFTKLTTVGAAQDAFHAGFPYLKIGFFTRGHKEHGASNAKFMVTDRNLLLADIPGFKNEGVFDIDPGIRTWEMEKMIEDQTGLHIQLFRKSGNLWLESTITDDLTLEQQNERAREYEEYHQPIVDPMDYRERD